MSKHDKEVPDYKKRARVISKRREKEKKDRYKLSEGPNCYRVLPTPEGKRSPSVFWEYLMHNKVGPDKKWLRCGHEPEDDDKKRTTKCYLCDKKIPELIKQKKDARAQKLAPILTLAVQVSEVAEDDDEVITFSDPMLFTPSPKNAGTLLTNILSSKSRNYEDPKRGYNLNQTRTGTGQYDTTYGPIEPDEEPTKVPSRVIAKLKPFDQLKGMYPYEEDAQRAAYKGEEYKPKRSKRSDSDDDGSDEDISGDVESGDDVFDSDDSGDKKRSRKESKKDSDDSEEDAEKEKKRDKKRRR